jgi:hypothetical protein
VAFQGLFDFPSPYTSSRSGFLQARVAKPLFGSSNLPATSNPLAQGGLRDPRRFASRTGGLIEALPPSGTRGLVFEVPGTSHFDVTAADAVAVTRDDAHGVAAMMTASARKDASAATQHQGQNADQLFHTILAIKKRSSTGSFRTEDWLPGSPGPRRTPLRPGRCCRWRARP